MNHHDYIEIMQHAGRIADMVVERSANEPTKPVRLSIATAPLEGEHALVLETPIGREIMGVGAFKSVQAVAHAVQRILKARDVTEPGTLFKYLPERFMEGFLDGKVYISPAARFDELDNGLSSGQTDNETRKVTSGARNEVFAVYETDAGVEFNEDSQELTLTSEPYWMWCGSSEYRVALLVSFN